MSSLTIEDWAEEYGVAWETANSDAAASLFTEHATYRANIYEEPHYGRAGVAEYWTGVTATQSDVTVRMGRPRGDSSRATVEFWTTMRIEGSPMTLVGSLIVDFDGSGLCQALREYWNFAEGTIEPPEGWGD